MLIGDTNLDEKLVTNNISDSSVVREVNSVPIKSILARQRWSIMLLAKAADTESVNTAKKEKLQVITSHIIQIKSGKIFFRKELMIGWLTCVRT